MSILKKFCIAVVFFFAFMSVSFAAENNEEVKPNVIQKTINNYILEVYKIQWNKILQDLDASLEKVAPTKEAKIEAYSHIQETFKLKKKSIEEENDEKKKNSQIILVKYLDHMIKLIDNKKTELQ